MSPTTPKAGTTAKKAPARSRKPAASRTPDAGTLPQPKVSAAVVAPDDQSAVRREIAAQFLAIGTTVARAAAEAGVEERAVYTWKTDEAFLMRVAAIRAVAFEQLESDIWANVRLALDLERRVYTGEIAADDPAWREAKPTLDKIRDQLLRDAAPQAPAAPAGTPFVYVDSRSGMVDERPTGGRVIEHQE